MNRSIWVSVTTGVRLAFAIFILVMLLITVFGLNSDANATIEQQIPECGSKELNSNYPVV